MRWPIGGANRCGAVTGPITRSRAAPEDAVGRAGAHEAQAHGGVGHHAVHGHLHAGGLVGPQRLDRVGQIGRRGELVVAADPVVGRRGGGRTAVRMTAHERTVRGGGSIRSVLSRHGAHRPWALESFEPTLPVQWALIGSILHPTARRFWILPRRDLASKHHRRPAL